LQLVAINADWLVNSMNGSISTVLRKQWVALILLPAVSSIAGTYRVLCVGQETEPVF
jgi:hypothetical protein